MNHLIATYEIAVASLATISVFFFFTTLYFRKKYKKEGCKNAFAGRPFDLTDEHLGKVFYADQFFELRDTSNSMAENGNIMRAAVNNSSDLHYFKILPSQYYELRKYPGHPYLLQKDGENGFYFKPLYNSEDVIQYNPEAACVRG